MTNLQKCCLPECDKPVDPHKVMYLGGQRIVGACCQEHLEDGLRREGRQQNGNERTQGRHF